MIVIDNERFIEQLDDAAISAFVRVFAGSPVVGATMRSADDEAGPGSLAAATSDPDACARSPGQG